MSLSLFIVIVTGSALGVFIGGTLLKKFSGGNQQLSQLQNHVDYQIQTFRQMVIEQLETHFQSQHQFFQREKAELDDALRHSLQELVITLQTVKSYSEIDEVRKQEQLEWAISKAYERFNKPNEDTTLLLREILETIKAQGIASAPVVETSTPEVKAVKRVRKPRTPAAKTAKADKVTKAEKKPV